jgi:two-component system, NtrC family, sensor kinase
MQTFVWDQRFETGIPLVDAQHKQLVDLTNQLGDTLAFGNDMDSEALQAVFRQLASYGRKHFTDEERLMGEAGLSGQHKDLHIAHHQQFIEQLVALWQARGAMTHPAETLHGFLAAWLTVHILGEDHAMARQMRRIHEGKSPAEAYAQETGATDPATAILLDAMQRLYALVADQNKNLAQANQQLEARVQDRTRELASANLELENEREELTQLLSKVEEAQQQLLQSEKMAAIGQLAAGVAHEINNPVGFVNSNLGTLRTYIGRLMKVISAYEQCAISGPREQLDTALVAADLDFLREDLPSLIEESQEGLARVTKIVQDLKDFSHVDEVQFQPANLNTAMESTLNVVWNELKYKAEVSREYGDIPDVNCVPAQINQVFMNLLVNAAQAIEQRGKITVRSGVERDLVWFEIEDTGKGMSDEVRSRIFEPFYTTKPVGKGTGLGLSISYDIIVKKHHGNIDVTSRPGVGTCFRIWLPVDYRNEETKG